MSNARSASAAQPATPVSPRVANESRSVRLPGEDLSLNEMMRVMDVARELRRNRDVAEEMFRRDTVREELRAKLMKSAAIAGDRVTEAEVDAAIDQYFKSLHTYSDPEPSLQRMLAHAWVWRWRLAAVVVPVATIAMAAAAALGGLTYLFF
jgi:hypothetical protein